MSRNPLALAVRRERAARRRLRLALASLAIALCLAALALMGARSMTRPELVQVLGQPGFWVPLGILASAILALLVARRRFGQVQLRLEEDRVVLEPSLLRRVLTSASRRELGVAKVRQAGTLALGEGSLMALKGGADPPLLVPLCHPAAAGVMESLLSALPASAWEERARAQAAALVEASRPGQGHLGRQPLRADELDQETLEAAGLWHLAAARAWPALLKDPRDLSAGLALYGIERHRLPAAPRLRLALALASLHPDEQLFTFEVARLGLALRLRELASGALDALAGRPDPPSPAKVWRLRLRERRALPAPSSRATVGIEIGMPHHRLEGDTLVVNDRHRVGLDWFVAFRLLPGFWGPSRGFELVDLWGARRLVKGDPLEWASALHDAAPHLSELTEEGWVWPSPGSWIRALERAR